MTTSDDAPISIAVVGHTNTGKTSLIRTLLRSNTFGAVADAAGTTRHVEQAAILVAGRPAVSLFDTPGLEDAAALLEFLQTMQVSGDRLKPREAVLQFLQSVDANPDFTQEAKVLRQGLKCDALLYVVDVRSPVLEKYYDEIAILGFLGKPIIPVFNFIADGTAQLAAWRDMMINHNLHAAVEFDTVAFDFDAEKRLYQKLQSLLESRYEQLQILIDARSHAWQQLEEAAVRCVVDRVVDVAIFRVTVNEARDGSAAKQQAVNTLQTSIRHYEQRCLRDVLRLFDFSSRDVELLQLPVSDGAWQLDLFSANTLKMFGLNAGSSALTGAAMGAGLDMMTGGLSLGAASLIGAALGASYSTARRFGQDIKAAVLRNDWLCADDLTVALVYLRAEDLLAHIVHRGHAAQTTTTINTSADKALPSSWTKILRGLRSGQVSKDVSNHAYIKARQQLHDALMQKLTGDPIVAGH